MNSDDDDFTLRADSQSLLSFSPLEMPNSDLLNLDPANLPVQFSLSQFSEPPNINLSPGLPFSQLSGVNLYLNSNLFVNQMTFTHILPPNR